MKPFHFFFMLFLFPILLNSQIEATTNDGKRVILNDDGTWRYTASQLEESSEEIELTCENLISTEYDKMTDKTTTAIKESIIISEDGGKTGFGIYLFKAGKNTYGMLISVVGAGSCIEEKGKADVLFRDGSRQGYLNNGGFNCDQLFSLYFGGVHGKKTEIDKFTSKEVEALRVWTSKGYVEKNFSEYQSQQLMKAFQCLTD